MLVTGNETEWHFGHVAYVVNDTHTLRVIMDNKDVLKINFILFFVLRVILHIKFDFK